MQAARREELGRTLGRAWGFPQLRGPGLGYRVRRAALGVAAIAAFIAGTLATSAAATEQPYAGVLDDSTGETVVGVSATGFAWRDGIRPGQRIKVSTPADSPGGWRLETEDAARRYVSLEDPIDSALADSYPIALVGLGTGCFALLFLRTHRGWVMPAASAALLASSVPLFYLGDPISSTWSMAFAAVVPGAWLVGRLVRPLLVQLFLFACLAAFLSVWTIARVNGVAGYDELEVGRRALLVVGLGALVVDRTIRPLLAGELSAMVHPRLLELVAVGGVAGLVLLLVLVGNVPPTLIGVTLVLTVLLLPSLRRLVSHRFGWFLVADVGQRAAADAMEAERARIVRDIHDSPLQQLAGVIRRLEVKPDAREEAVELQAVATQLRSLLVDLRPPVLDDLGLGAALEFLAQPAPGRAVPISADISDASHERFGDRPPAEVELAMFRIAQEAIGNAAQHAQASDVHLTARISPNAVDLEIADDGIGIPSDATRLAAKKGRLGLASMQRRAFAIDADLKVERVGHGTVVRVTWRR